jgi:hypothetical protein
MMNGSLDCLVDIISMKSLAPFVQSILLYCLLSLLCLSPLHKRTFSPLLSPPPAFALLSDTDNRVAVTVTVALATVRVNAKARIDVSGLLSLKAE